MDGNILGLALPLGLGLAAIGSGLGLGKAVAGAMEAMGRQPEAIGQIQTAMIIGLAFIEALTIYALVTVFVLMGKLSVDSENNQVGQMLGQLTGMPQGTFAHSLSVDGGVGQASRASTLSKTSTRYNMWHSCNKVTQLNPFTRFQKYIIIEIFFLCKII